MDIPGLSLVKFKNLSWSGEYTLSMRSELSVLSHELERSRNRKIVNAANSKVFGNCYC